MSVSDEFIFKRNAEGVLELLGDFDGYYKTRKSRVWH